MKHFHSDQDFEQAVNHLRQYLPKPPSVASDEFDRLLNMARRALATTKFDQMRNLVDINDVKHAVGIQVGRGVIGTNVWVNVDGQCVLRVNAIHGEAVVTVEDNR